MEELLPVIIMSESFFAGLTDACMGRSGESLYWLSAAVFNLAVIFLVPGGK